MTGAAYNRGKSRQDYETPGDLIVAVERRFGPIVRDLAADRHNARALVYFDEEQNSLAQPWADVEGLQWLNPPFGHLEPWARKLSFAAMAGARIALLVPAAMGANWYAKWIHNQALVLGLHPKPSFDGKHAYPKDVILAVTGEPVGFEPWRWKL